MAYLDAVVSVASQYSVPSVYAIGGGIEDRSSSKLFGILGDGVVIEFPDLHRLGVLDAVSLDRDLSDLDLRHEYGGEVAHD